MIWLMAVTWPCHLDVEDYAGAGQTPFPSRLVCPDCALAATFDGSDPRVERHRGLSVVVCRSTCRRRGAKRR